MAGAVDVSRRRRSAHLPAAIGPCRFVLGATASRRGVPDELAPREAAQRILAALSSAATRSKPCSVTNAPAWRTTRSSSATPRSRFPAILDVFPLNLSQAVQVVAYELRLAWLQQSVEAVGSLRAAGEQSDSVFSDGKRADDIGTAARAGDDPGLRRLFLRSRIAELRVPARHSPMRSAWRDWRVEAASRTSP